MGKSVWKSIAMITQIGISMMVPIFLCVFIGVKLDGWLNTGFFVIIFMLLGVGAAFRNVYLMTKTFYSKDMAKEKAELQYYEEMRKQREASLGTKKDELSNRK